MHTIPESIAPQVGLVVQELRAILGDEIVVVIHGSVALGDYQPGRSDLDMLVFVHAALTKRQHMKLATAMLRLSGLPAPIEISVLDGALLSEWVHPTPFYFHYSEDWRVAMASALADSHHVWVDTRTDADVSAHMVIAHTHGVMVYGHAQLPLPTAQQALAAVWYDIAEAETQVHVHPEYVILNLCRTIRWLEHGEVHSKGSGGAAMIAELDDPAQTVVAQMMAMRSGMPGVMPEAALLQQVARQLLMRIRSVTGME